MDFKSRYAVKSDCQDKLGVYDIPDEWWSRKAEYPWAAQYAQPNDTVADMACGVPHFFKNQLAYNCDKVYAVDNDLALLDLKDIPDNMELVCSDLWHVPELLNDSIDVVFCISVLEHLTPTGRAMALTEMRRTLKVGGLLVVTFDVPVVTPEAYGQLATEAGLVWAGPVDMSRPVDVLHSDKWQLDVFMSVLRKPEW